MGLRDRSVGIGLAIVGGVAAPFGEFVGDEWNLLVLFFVHGGLGGRISGTVAIVGNQSRSGLGRTVGSVEVKRTASVWGAAGVTGNHAWQLNGVGKRRVSPVVSRSVIVGMAVNRVYQ